MKIQYLPTSGIWKIDGKPVKRKKVVELRGEETAHAFEQHGRHLDSFNMVKGLLSRDQGEGKFYVTFPDVRQNRR